VATKVIAPTGNDTTGTGSEANPWRSLNKLFSSLVAGDTGLCRGGSYVGSLLDCGIQVGSSGTAPAPIIVKRYPGDGEPIFDGTGAAITTENYNIQYILNARYHELRWLTFRNWNWWPARAGNGSSNINMDETGGTPGDVRFISILNNTFEASALMTPGLNDWMIYVGGACQDILIRGNRITGGGTTAPGTDYTDFGGGINVFQTPGVQRIVIDNNLIGFCRFGVNFGEGTSSDLTATHNTGHHNGIHIFTQAGDLFVVRDNAGDNNTNGSNGYLQSGGTNYTADHNYVDVPYVDLVDYTLPGGSPAIAGALDGSDAGWTAPTPEAAASSDRSAQYGRLLLRSR
jgi:hypothetical protein